MKDSKLSKEQQAWAYDLIKEHCEAFSLCDEIGKNPQVEVRLKVFDEAPFFLCPYIIREEQKSVMEKGNESPQKIINN